MKVIGDFNGNLFPFFCQGCDLSDAGVGKGDQQFHFFNGIRGQAVLGIFQKQLDRIQDVSGYTILGSISGCTATP